MKILTAKNEKVNLKFVYYMMQGINFDASTHKRYYLSQYAKQKIPFPPFEVQERIVEEIETYQNIIDGAKKVALSYKPSFKIDPEWDVVELGEVCKIKSGGTPSKSEKKYWENGTIPWVGSTVCKDKPVYEPINYITEQGLKNSSAKILIENTSLIALVGATIGKTALLKFECTTNQNIAGLFPLDTNKLNEIYLYYSLQTLYSKFMKLGDGKFKMANLSFVKSLKIPLPPIETQKEIVAQIEEEQKLVDSNKQLIEIFEKKIKDRISEVWGE
jgi:restriction endonuclease S subunit